ncbi:MAG: nucleoside kinase [Desulfitobacteriaceae bacterium]|nr:nucleoside kinase [Desulfitobacteriaceae bacterium]MDD4751668.1 nucleoside kinase [Desulfitobacteriaceae bacterium]
MSMPTLKKIQVKIDADIHQIPRGTTLQEVLEKLSENVIPTAAALVNGELQELTYPLYADSIVQWLDLTTDAGLRIYKRSINFVLLAAVSNLFPHHQLKIEHSLAKGTYCELRGEPTLSPMDIARIQEEMQSLVALNLPITRREVSRDDAQKYFLSCHRPGKAQLISYKPGDTVYLYTCGPVTDYFFGPMAPNTGCLKYFELRPFDKGFILIVPDKDNPTGFSPYREPKKLAAVFSESERRGELVGVDKLAQLNELIQSGQESDIIQIAETLHERNLHKISNDICVNRDIRLVLIAGPSSSGKTTFAQRLSIQFRVNGIKPVAISLDNYFVDREINPRDENGEYDFEHINALDLELFNTHLEELIAGKEVTIPLYDFKTGSRIPNGDRVKLGPDQILIVEGIHGLNEMLTASISQKNKRKIYVSALTQLSIDDYNPIPSSDTRLIRRMARDLQFRGTSVQDTLKRWISVRRGEEKNIFPYQEDADYIFNSALAYELAVLKGLVEPELEKLPSWVPEYVEAKRLLYFLEYIIPISPENVPLNSILREFCGGSCFLTC